MIHRISNFFPRHLLSQIVLSFFSKDHIVQSPILARITGDVEQKIHLKKQCFFPENNVIIALNTIGKMKIMNFISLPSDYHLDMKKFGVTISQFNPMISSLLTPINLLLRKDLIILLLKLLLEINQSCLILFLLKQSFGPYKFVCFLFSSMYFFFQKTNLGC